VTAQADGSRAEAEVRAASQDAAGRIRATDVLSGEDVAVSPSHLSDSSHGDDSHQLFAACCKVAWTCRDARSLPTATLKRWSSTASAPVAGAR